MSQTERIFDILYRLSREGGYVRLSGISERFGISIRQAGRDIEYIRDRVLPDSSSLIYDRAIRAYRISDDADILSSWRERMILSLALYDAAASDTPGGLELSSSIPSSMRKVLSHVEYRENRRSLIGDERFIGAVIRAFDEDLTLELIYHKQGGHAGERRLVEPLRLINYESAWYLLSYDLGKKAIRTFRLSRVESLSVTGRKAFRRSEEEIRRIARGAYGIFMTSSEPEAYTMRFSGGAALSVSAEIWHDEQKGRWIDGYVYELTVPAMGPKELISRILSYGKEAVPVSPPAFVDGYWKELEAMMERGRVR